MPIDRNYNVRRDEIERLMQRNGLSIAKLAEQSITSTRTVQRILDNRRARISTLNKIAKVLRTTPDALIEGASSTAEFDRAVNTAAARVTAGVQVPFETFDETSALPAWVQGLIQAIGDKGEVIVIVVKPGTVQITIALSDEADLPSLLRAFCDRSLWPLAVESLDLRALKQDATPIVAKAIYETVAPARYGGEWNINERIRTKPTRPLFDRLSERFLVAVPSALKSATTYVQEFEYASDDSVLITEYDSAVDKLVSLRTIIPAQELAAAQAALAGWTTPE